MKFLLRTISFKCVFVIVFLWYFCLIEQIQSLSVFEERLRKALEGEKNDLTHHLSIDSKLSKEAIPDSNNKQIKSKYEEDFSPHKEASKQEFANESSSSSIQYSLSSDKANTNTKTGNKKGKEIGKRNTNKDPLNSLSNEELEKMLNDYKTKDNKKEGPKDAQNHPLLSADNLLKEESLGIDFSQDPISNLLDLNGGNKKSSTESLIKKIRSDNIHSIQKFKLKEKDAFNLILMLKENPFFSRLPTTAKNIIAESYNKPSFKKLSEHFRNTTQENSQLVSSTLSSQSFIDYSNKLGRKGLVTMITPDSSTLSVWLVVNPQVFAVFSSKNHLQIQRLYRLSNIEIIDFFDSSCFQVSLKSDELRQVKLDNVEKSESEGSLDKSMLSMSLFANSNKRDHIRSSTQSREINHKASKSSRTNLRSEVNDNQFENTAEKVLVTELVNRGLLKAEKDVYCTSNKKEKIVWINSIKHHQFSNS